MDYIPSNRDADKRNASRRPASLFTPEELEEFRRFYEEDFLEAISLGEAENQARTLLELYFQLAQRREQGPDDQEPKRG